MLHFSKHRSFSGEKPARGKEREYIDLNQSRLL